MVKNMGAGSVVWGLEFCSGKYILEDLQKIDLDNSQGVAKNKSNRLLGVTFFRPSSSFVVFWSFLLSYIARCEFSVKIKICSRLLIFELSDCTGKPKKMPDFFL